MPIFHARFMEPEALREHLRVSGDPALAKTTDTGALDDDTARALIRVITTKGDDGGSLDIDADADVLAAAAKVLGSNELASQLLEGGWLDRRGVGALSFGSLPLRVLQREVIPARLRAAKAEVTSGWESELINLLESSAMRATRAPEEHLVLLPAVSRLSVVPRAEFEVAEVQATVSEVPSATRVLKAFIEKLRSSSASDLTLRAGEPPLLHSPAGVEPLGNVPLSSSDVRAVVDAARPPMSGGRDVWTADLIRFVVGSELEGPSLSMRKLAREVPSLESLGVSPLVQTPLIKLKRGLVLLTGEPGSARTTLYSALLARFASEGRRVASLEEPLGFSLRGVRQSVVGEHTTVDSFVRTSRLQPLDVVGFDLLDDARALDLALDTALDGRLAVCVFRAPNVTTAVHRAAVIDARFHRRRVADHLAAISFQRLARYDVVASLELDFHLPSVALRRHLRAQETPPPPVAFESDTHDS